VRRGSSSPPAKALMLPEAPGRQRDHRRPNRDERGEAHPGRLRRRRSVWATGSPRPAPTSAAPRRRREARGRGIHVGPARRPAPDEDRRARRHDHRVAQGLGEARPLRALKRAALGLGPGVEEPPDSPRASKPLRSADGSGRPTRSGAAVSAPKAPGPWGQARESPRPKAKSAAAAPRIAKVGLTPARIGESHRAIAAPIGQGQTIASARGAPTCAARRGEARADHPQARHLRPRARPRRRPSRGAGRALSPRSRPTPRAHLRREGIARREHTAPPRRC
jgi:hypothetical protein